MKHLPIARAEWHARTWQPEGWRCTSTLFPILVHDSGEEAWQLIHMVLRQYKDKRSITHGWSGLSMIFGRYACQEFYLKSRT